MRFGQTVPALPARDVARAGRFYAEYLGFDSVHAEDGFAILRRDGAEVHVWGASDESWRDRIGTEPVRSGAESFIAGTASCRIAVEGIAQLYEASNAAGIVHPNGHLSETDWGTREFGILDPDGNLVTFFER